MRHPHNATRRFLFYVLRRSMTNLRMWEPRIAFSYTFSNLYLGAKRQISDKRVARECKQKSFESLSECENERVSKGDTA